MNFKDMIRTMRFKEDKRPHHQLYTPWGETLDTEHVLEEYPRPQLRRDNYSILNGYWDYSITEKNTIPKKYEEKILVPFSPESILSGVNRQLMPNEFLWYRRTIQIEKIAENQRCILHFGAVDQFCEIYMNTKKISRHSGGYLPFSIDITKELKEGANTLIVKVTDESDTSYHTRGKQKLDRGGMFYTAQSGIWQTVWLEWVPSLYITSLKITPLPGRKGVEIIVRLNSRELNDALNKKGFRVDILKKGKLLKSFRSKHAHMFIPMKVFEYWTPENPVLYDITVTVGEDRVKSYFAMRTIEIKKDKDNIPCIYLNHKLYFQNGILDQGYWPDGLYTAPSDEAFIYDIKKAKELGFNMIRKHLKIEPLRWYYHCDRLGMIVWQDMVNGGGHYNTLLVGYLPTFIPAFAGWIKDNHYRLFGRINEKGRRDWTAECMQTIDLLYNSPSVLVWVLFNEGWGQFDSKRVYDLVQKKDSSRLIDHASGWFDQNQGDFHSVHNYFHPLKVKTGRRPVVLSEFGGYACYMKDHSYSWQIYGYRIYLNEKSLDEDFQKLYREEIKKLKEKGLSAAVYTQLSDVEDEVNGLLTYDRKVCKVNALKPF